MHKAHHSCESNTPWFETGVARKATKAPHAQTFSVDFHARSPFDVCTPKPDKPEARNGGGPLWLLTDSGSAAREDRSASHARPALRGLAETTATLRRSQTSSKGLEALPAREAMLPPRCRRAKTRRRRKVSRARSWQARAHGRDAVRQKWWGERWKRHAQTLAKNARRLQDWTSREAIGTPSPPEVPCSHKIGADVLMHPSHMATVSKRRELGAWRRELFRTSALVDFRNADHHCTAPSSSRGVERDKGAAGRSTLQMA